MNNMMFVILENSVKAATKPKEKKQPSKLKTGLLTLISACTLLFYVVCLLCALPYVFM